MAHPRSRWLAALIERRAGTIAVVTLLFAALAIACATQLKLDQRLRYLLPESFPSVAGIDRVTERLGNQSDVYVTIESPSREANIELGDAVASRMNEMDSLRWVLFRRDYQYFEDRALLYIPLTDLLDLRNRVIEKIQDEVRKQAYGGMSLASDEEKKKQAEQKKLDEQALRDRYGLGEDPPEFFEAKDGQLMVVKARPTEESTNLEFSRALQADLEALVDELDPTSFHPEMKVRLDGAFVQHTKRVQALPRGGHRRNGGCDLRLARRDRDLLSQRASRAARARAASGLRRRGAGVRVARVRGAQPRVRLHLRGTARAGDRLRDPRARALPRRACAGPSQTDRVGGDPGDDGQVHGRRGPRHRVRLRHPLRGGLPRLRAVRNRRGIRRRRGADQLTRRDAGVHRPQRADAGVARKAPGGDQTPVELDVAGAACGRAADRLGGGDRLRGKPRDGARVRVRLRRDGGRGRRSPRGLRPRTTAMPSARPSPSPPRSGSPRTRPKPSRSSASSWRCA